MASTAYDVQREYMITGAKLDGKYQFPVMPLYTLNRLPKDTIDFDLSFGKKLKRHKDLMVNFYIHDYKFERLWNNPDKYIEHLRCFHSVIAPDYSIATSESGMPFVLNLYNKYRNHALAYYMHLHNISVIPSVGIYDENSYDWCFDGYPKHSVVAVSTNGRMRNSKSKQEFCKGFEVMCEKLEPSKVILIGRVPDNLNPDIPILNYETRTQKIGRG